MFIKTPHLFDAIYHVLERRERGFLSLAV